jgi:hypothetical protein
MLQVLITIIKQEELLSDESEKVLQRESIIQGNERIFTYVGTHTETILLRCLYTY